MLKPTRKVCIQPAHRKFLGIHQANICNIFDLAISFKTILPIKDLNKSTRTLSHIPEKNPFF
ncbi:hypothetical protein LEP1GSC062_2618 [Leptospira alexanderi serovar Manhao 3 str. L 60]|uniref:Uncharacterized protein n=1 Tax=Leptospira alexanderi serovar Manhao 3 str. L 60 TaxID=1049759 RepID=V6HVW0_9LEPT|nr:hypothetical protein LEP1GSC062_2618 [Leptospira alexanderi serovar Manhao 3 str. L 60]